MTLKAFELISVIERTLDNISCFEASGNDLYLGYDEGLLFRYSIEERIDSTSGRAVYSSNEICHKSFNAKKQIEQLKAASALTRLLVLSDGNLYLLDSDVLSLVTPSPKVKNALVFCVNENPTTADPFTLQLCVGKRKCLQICSLHDDRVSLLREIPTPDASVTMAMDGRFVCTAGMTQYCVYDVESGRVQDLFPCKPQTNIPHIKRISKEEFLVVGPGNLGMLVTAAGTSERPPIQWIEGIISISYYHPYVLVVTHQLVNVYSLIDQQLKQTITLNGGKLIGNFDGQLYIATNSSIYCLMPQPWTSQVMDLIANEFAEEAIELMKHNGGAGMSNVKYIKFSQNVFQKVGFIKFSHECFDEAQEYFIAGRLDIREVLSLYPGMLDSDTFMRSQPPLHRIADIGQAFHGVKEKIEKAKEFLRNFLFHIRTSKEPNPFNSELDTALLKLYSEEDYEKLLIFLENEDLRCSVDDCVAWLRKRHQFNAVARLYKTFGEIEKCLNMMTKMVLGEHTDNSFGGITELVSVITSCQDPSFTWRYANFVLEKNLEEGIRLFCESSAPLEADQVLKYLVLFPMAKVAYLRHLIFDKGIEGEHYHTELILHYLEKVLKKVAEGFEDTEDRPQLQRLLKSSKHYNAKTILARLEGTDLLLETACVYGRLKEHERALFLLVHKLKDFSAAEEYCVHHSKGLKKAERSSIFMILLKIYLRPPKDGGPDSAEVAPALDLLSVHASELDLKDVLQVLPSNWSLSVAQQYLRSAFRTAIHENRMQNIQQNLIKCDDLHQKFIFQKLCADVGPISLSSSRICYACGKSFHESAFAIYPNGVITHRKCGSKQDFCPLTGTLFRATKPPSGGVDRRA